MAIYLDDVQVFDGPKWMIRALMHDLTQLHVSQDLLGKDFISKTEFRLMMSSDFIEILEIKDSKNLPRIVRIIISDYKDGKVEMESLLREQYIAFLISFVKLLDTRQDL